MAHEIEINDTEAKSIAVKADITKENQVQNMFRISKQQFGTVDILVNTAGL